MLNKINPTVLRISIILFILILAFVSWTSIVASADYTACAVVAASLAIAGSTALGACIVSLLIANGLRFTSVASMRDVALDFYSSCTSAVKTALYSLAENVASGSASSIIVGASVLNAVASFIAGLFAINSAEVYSASHPGYFSSAPYFVSSSIPILTDISIYETSSGYDFNTLPIFTDYDSLTTIDCGSHGTMYLLASSLSGSLQKYYVTDGTGIYSYTPESTNESIIWQTVNAGTLLNGKHWGWTIELNPSYSDRTSGSATAFFLRSWMISNEGIASSYAASSSIIWPALSLYNITSVSSGYVGTADYFPTGSRALDDDDPIYIPTGSLVNPEVLIGATPESVRTSTDVPIDVPIEGTAEGTLSSDGTGDGIFSNVGRFILGIPILGSILRALLDGFALLQSLLEAIVNALSGFLDGVIEGITQFWNGIPDHIRGIKQILQNILDALRNLIGLLGDFLSGLVSFIPTIISLITGYTLYQGLINHFLPAPVAAVCWCFYLATVAIWIFRLVLNR